MAPQPTLREAEDEGQDTPNQLAERTRQPPSQEVQDTPSQGVLDTPSQGVLDTPSQGVQGTPSQEVQDTPNQLAHRTRPPASQGRTVTDIDLVFKRFPGMDLVEAHHLLLRKLSVDDKDSEGSTGLLATCRAGRGDIAAWYIQLGAEVNVVDTVSGFPSSLRGTTNSKGCTPLHYACVNGLVHAAELLIQHHAKLTTSAEGGNTALHLACLCRSHSASADITRLLLQAGVEVNQRNLHGATPLLLAARSGLSGVVDLLTRYGAEVNASNQEGFAPLMFAAKNGLSGTADLLLRRGAHVNAQNKHGQTPLMYAAWMRHSDTVELLLRQGADVNTQTKEGDTPLMWVVRNSDSDTADLLLHHGANVNAQNHWGDTPLMWAARNGHSGLADLLIRHGATRQPTLAQLIRSYGKRLKSIFKT